jgi:MFS family permease
MHFTSLKYFIERHRQHLLTVSFVLGFLIDNITLNRVDQLFDNALLLTHITIAMLSLAFLYAASAGKLRESWNEPVRNYSPLITQFAFGSLFSGMLIFYGRSGSWMVSWPFFLMLLAVIYGNETIKDRVQRLLYNLGMLFIGLFSYVVLIVPVLLGKMSALVFVGSGILALVIMLIFVRILTSIVPRFISLHQRSIIFIIGIIFAGFNFLYFANLIPPIPLSLKDVGVFHSVVRFEDGSYQLSYEKGEWWKFYRTSDDVYHPSAGGSIFCFAKVFAPTSIDTDIYHAWDYYDETAGKWIEHARVSYPIQGGGDGGYRGYTLIKNYRDGKWRCSVETQRGQVLGRATFRVDSSSVPVEIVTRRE